MLKHPVADVKTSRIGTRGYGRLCIALLGLLLLVALLPANAPAAAPATKPATPQAPPTVSPGTITMNFRDADIDSVLAFLSMAGGVTVVKDPSITGKVTVIAPKALSFDEALALLNNILQTQGATAVRTDNLVRVVPSEKAGSTSAVRVGAEVADIPAVDQIITQIIPLKGLKATDVQKQLTPLFAGGSAVAADEQTNTLIITDFASHIRRVVEILRDLEEQQEAIATARERQGARDGDSRKDRTGKLKGLLAAAGGTGDLQETKVNVKVISLRYAPARQLADELSRILNSPQSSIPAGLATTVQKLAGSDSKKAEALLRILQGQLSPSPGPTPQSAAGAASLTSTPDAGIIPNRVVADSFTNSLVVTGMADVTTTIEQLVSQLDQAQAGSGPQYVTFVRPLEHADAAGLANTLNSLFAGFARQLPRQSTSQGGPSALMSQGASASQVAPASQAPPAESASAPASQAEKMLASIAQSSPTQQLQVPASVSTPLQLQLAGVPITVVADSGTNSLLITTAAEVKGELESLIAELDQEDSDQIEVSFLYQLRYADATNLAAVLNRFYSSSTGATAFSKPQQTGLPGHTRTGQGKTKNGARVNSSVKSGNKPASGSSAGSSTSASSSSKAKPKRRSGAAPRAASIEDGVQVVADKDSNTLLVVAMAGVVADVKTTIAALDQPGSGETYATRVFTLTKADATDLAKALSQIFTGTGRNAFPLGGLNLAEPNSEEAGGKKPNEEVDAPTNRPPVIDNVARFIRIVAETETNSLIVIAPGAMMEEIGALISRFDDETPATNLVTAVYPLQHADSAALAKTLTDFFAGASRVAGQKTTRSSPVLSGLEAQVAWQRLQGSLAQKSSPQQGAVAAERGGKTQGPGSPGFFGQVWIVSEPATNSLLITAPADAIEDVKTIVKELDLESPVNSETGMTVYRLQNASASVLADLMNSLFGADGKGAPKTYSSSPSLRPTGAVAASQQLAAPAKAGTATGGSTTQSTGQFRAKVSPQTASASGGDARFVPDPATNSLVITASPFLMGEIKAMLAELDARPAQVLIEAKVVEVSLDKNDAFGAEWKWLSGNSSGSAGGGGSTGGSGGLTLGGSLGSILTGTDFKFSILTGDIQVALQALAQQAELNVLSTPRILTLNNTPASIVIGNQVPYLQSTKKDPAGNEQQFYGYRDVGISLRVTPRIGESGNVYLDIAQQTDNLGSDVIAATGAPTVATRQAQTSVVVKDGQTMVIGGLMRDNTSESVHKVPLLGDLPILGQLFRSKDTIAQKTELLIFITPHVVRDDDEAATLTQQEHK